MLAFGHGVRAYKHTAFILKPTLSFKSTKLQKIFSFLNFRTSLQFSRVFKPDNDLVAPTAWPLLDLRPRFCPKPSLDWFLSFCLCYLLKARGKSGKSDKVTGCT